MNSGMKRHMSGSFASREIKIALWNRNRVSSQGGAAAGSYGNRARSPWACRHTVVRAFRMRPLTSEHCYLWVDATYYNVASVGASSASDRRRGAHYQRRRASGVVGRREAGWAPSAVESSGWPSSAVG